MTLNCHCRIKERRVVLRDTEQLLGPNHLLQRMPQLPCGRREGAPIRVPVYMTEKSQKVLCTRNELVMDKEARKRYWLPSERPGSFMKATTNHFERSAGDPGIPHQHW